MIKLVLLRHGESEWNLANKFTGWKDVELTDTGRAQAKQAGVVLKEAGFEDIRIYGSFDGDDYDLASERLVAVAQK